jgi:GTP-binding protein YchF
VLKAGIVGLPNVGKSTLFNALTASYQAESANYPFCTIEPNQGMVMVPDLRLKTLGEINHSKSVLEAVFEFVDIAGLVRGASQGAGLGNQFLGHIREVDAIVHVVRCFEDENIVHVDGQVDPVRDAETIILELALSDMESIEKRLVRLNKGRKGALKEVVMEADLLEQILPIVSEGQRVDAMGFKPEEQSMIATLHLLSTKPVLYAANVQEADLAHPDQNPHYQALVDFARQTGGRVVPISAQIEAELVELSAEERSDYLASLGVETSGVDRLIRGAFDLLGLETFFTSGPKETRAWPFTHSMTAQACAGLIHSDIARGFIRAEVIAYADYIACGGEKEAKEKGLMRQEGKDYLMGDGDVVYFRFNV